MEWRVNIVQDSNTQQGVPKTGTTSVTCPTEAINHGILITITEWSLKLKKKLKKPPIKSCQTVQRESI